MVKGDFDVAKVLAEIAGGEQDAAEQLMQLVYDELHHVTEQLLRHESCGLN